MLPVKERTDKLDCCWCCAHEHECYYYHDPAEVITPNNCRHFEYDGWGQEEE